MANTLVSFMDLPSIPFVRGENLVPRAIKLISFPSLTHYNQIQKQERASKLFLSWISETFPYNAIRNYQTLQTKHIAHSFTIKIPFLDKQTPKAHTATTKCPFPTIQALDHRLKSCKTNRLQEPFFFAK